MIKRTLYNRTMVVDWINDVLNHHLDVRKVLTQTGTYYVAYDPEARDDDQIFGLFGTNNEGGFIGMPVWTINTAKLMLKSFKLEIQDVKNR